MLTDPDLLVLDEVGLTIGSDDKRRAMLFDVLDTRYANLRATILIGNLTDEEMERYLGERIMDRLCEGDSAVVSFTWPSFRRSGGGV
jgi:DNA replication protein DnaC